MRTVTKFLAAAAIAAVSATSFAAPVTWTGTLSAVKFTYYPNNDGAGGNSLSLFGTGSSCSFVGTKGWMQIAASVETNAMITDTLNILTQAKASGATVSITYEPTQQCRILWINR